MRTSTPEDYCINGVQNCGGSGHFAEDVREWISEDFDGAYAQGNRSHESCGDRTYPWHSWYYASLSTSSQEGRPAHHRRMNNSLWVCCACSDALHLYRTIAYMIQELPI